MKLQIKYLYLQVLHKFSELNLVYKLILAATITCLVGLIFYFYIYAPQITSIKMLQQEISDLSLVHKKLAEKFNELDGCRLDSEKMCTNIKNLLNFCDNSFNEILHYTESANLTVNSFENLATKDKKAFVKKSVSLGLEGSFFNFITFLNILRQTNNICKIKDIAIKRKDEGLLEAKLVCNFYINGESHDL